MKKAAREGYKMTELGEIPNEWTIDFIKNITIEHKQGYYSKSEYDNCGTYLMRITDLRNHKIDFSEMPKIRVSKEVYQQYKLELGDFLFARSGTIGRYGIYNKEIYPKAIFASYIIKFKFNENLINNSYLGYFYESSYCTNQLKAITQGSSNININANNIKNLKICLPNLKEQEKIAEILSTVDEQIDNTEKLIQKNEDLKKGLMQQLLTKGIGHTEFKKTELGDIPKEWEIKNLDEISILIDGDRSNKYPGEKDIVENGILFLSTQNIVNSKINYDNCKFISQEKFNELSKGKLKKDDLVITLRGSIGNVAKFNGDVHNTGFINAQIMIIRSKNINSNYLSNYLISDCSQKQIIKISSGSAQPQLTKRELKKIKVIIPSEKEQKKISVILSILDKKLEEYKNKKEKLELLKKGLMQQLLNGNLRVKYSY